MIRKTIFGALLCAASFGVACTPRADRASQLPTAVHSDTDGSSTAFPSPSNPDQSLSDSSATNDKDRLPRSIIFVVIDGGGFGAHTYARQLAQSSHLNYPLDALPNLALVSTSPAAPDLITDSAAGATAYATGHKTRNAFVGLDAQGKPLLTLFEKAESMGYRSGVVVSSAISHATPASFVAHVQSREQRSTIADQMSSSPIDIALGGGRNDFQPFYPRLQKQAGKLWTEVEAFTQERNTAPAFPIWGFFGDDGLDPAPKRGALLVELTDFALARLEHDSTPFVLLVEASQVDWAEHANDAPWLKAELIDTLALLDRVVQFQATHPDVLIVVTADHETGGVKSLASNQPDAPRAAGHEVGFSTTEHTGNWVPLWATGPGAHRFHGVMENDQVGRILFELLHPVSPSTQAVSQRSM